MEDIFSERLITAFVYNSVSLYRAVQNGDLLRTTARYSDFFCQNITKKKKKRLGFS